MFSALPLRAVVARAGARGEAEAEAAAGVPRIIHVEVSLRQADHARAGQLQRYQRERIEQ